MTTDFLEQRFLFKFCSLRIFMKLRKKLTISGYKAGSLVDDIWSLDLSGNKKHVVEHCHKEWDMWLQYMTSIYEECT